MTRARRITQGERTASEIVHDPHHPIIASTDVQVGEPRVTPDRMCKSCEKAAEPDTAYGVAVAPTGLGHYTADATHTLCGRDHTDWPIT